MELDYLVLAAHPDDAELFCGGTLIKMRELGYQVGILDLTRGEAATCGSVEIRNQETENANKILQLAFRKNLGLEDGGLRDDLKTRRLLVDVVREYRVKIIIAPVLPCRHPDHAVVHHLARAVHFLSGNGAFPSEYPRWRPLRLLFHFENQDRKPSFIVNISDQFADKMRAIEAYSSQFHNKSNNQEQTMISSQRFRDKMRTRFEYFGNQIGRDYGEPFFIDEMLGIEDPLQLLC